MTIKYSHRACSAAVIAALAGTAVAQSPPPSADTGTEPALQEIVVTGSLIKRTNAETAEAVTIVKMDDLKDMGVTSVEGALALISANNASGVTTASNVASFNGGASFASLRGLGGARTLVLLDGQRLASNVNFGSSVDLNTIPFAAIDRIEVLREGASSEYGSDAIAGVINFITKKDYEGGEVNVNYDRPQHSGGASENVDISYGIGSLASDGYNLLISGNLTGQSELTASQRSFAATGYDPAASLANFNGPAGPAPGSFTDNAGDLWQVGYPNCAGNPHLAAVNGSCEYEYSGAVDLIPASKGESVLIDFTKSLPANNTLSVQYFWDRYDLQIWAGPQEYAFNISPTSPYYPTAAESTCVFAPCQNATPALGGPLSVGWTDPANNRDFENVNTEQRALVTFKGSNGGWDYSTDFNWSQNKGVQQVRGGEANYAILAPNGVISDLVNPFGPQTAAGTAFIDNAYTQGDLEIGKLSLYDLSGNASHPLGDLFNAGHPAAFAIGFDYRDEQITNQPTPLAATLYTATYYPPYSISGSRVSEAAYVELNVPVSPEAEFSISDRQDRYSDFGTTNNAKVTFDYRPFSALAFRGAASTGFRAPNLVNLYSPQTFGATAGNMNGPPCATGNYTTVFSAENCISQGLALSGGNPNLTPETSQNFDFGIILAPIANLGITIDYYRIIIKNSIGGVPSATIYANPTTFASDYVLNNAGTLSQASKANQECPTYTAATCGYILTIAQNTGGIVTDGVDFSVKYLINTDGFGKFRLGLEGTLVTDYRIQQYTGGPEINILGGFANYVAPVMKWQHLATLDWTYQSYGAGLSNQFTSRYTDVFPNAAGDLIDVSSYSVWNGYVSYKPIPSLKVLLGVNNIQDRNPPFSNQFENWQSGYNPIESSPLGRTFYVRGTFNF